MTKKEEVKEAVPEEDAEKVDNGDQQMSEKPEVLQGETKMAAEMPPMPEVGHIKVGLMAAPGGRQSINIETSDNMSYGLAIEMLESALGRLKSAPLKY